VKTTGEKSPALQPGQFSLTAAGAPGKNTLNRQQFGACIGFPLKRDRTFLFASYEGLISDAQRAVTILTTSTIFAPLKSQLAIIAALAAEPGNPMVPGIPPNSFL
jgi:hypothetical protein